MSPERSYSDREVALVLRRAAEIETSDESEANVAESQIVEIAREAGIGTEAVRRALEELRAESAVSGSSFFPPSSRRASRAIEGTLDRDALATLVQAVEDRVGSPGTVTEALGTVRWTSRSSLGTTQVALTSSGDGTRLGVHERVNDRARRIMFIVPANLGGMAGLITAGSLGLATGPMLAALGGGAALGFFVGREVARRFSNASERRVDRLAADLGEAARRLLPRAPSPAPPVRDDAGTRRDR